MTAGDKTRKRIARNGMKKCAETEWKKKKEKKRKTRKCAEPNGTENNLKKKKNQKKIKFLGEKFISIKNYLQFVHFQLFDVLCWKYLVIFWQLKWNHCSQSLHCLHLSRHWREQIEQIADLSFFSMSTNTSCQPASVK